MTHACEIAASSFTSACFNSNGKINPSTPTSLDNSLRLIKHEMMMMHNVDICDARIFTGIRHVLGVRILGCCPKLPGSNAGYGYFST